MFMIYPPQGKDGCAWSCTCTGNWLSGWENLTITHFNDIFWLCLQYWNLGTFQFLYDQFKIVSNRAQKFKKMLQHFNTISILKNSSHILKCSLDHGSQLTLVLFKKKPWKIYDYENLPFRTIFGSFWGLFNNSVTHIGLKRCFHIPKQLLERGGQFTSHFL